MNREFQTTHTETMGDAVAVEQLYAAAVEHLLKQKEAASVHSKAVQDATKAIEDARAEEERDKEAYETQCARLEEELRRLHAVRAQTVEAHAAKLEQLKATVKEHNDASAAVLASEPKLFFNVLTRTEDSDMPDEQTEDDDHAHNPGDGSGMMLFTTYYKGEWQMLSKFPFEEEPCLKCMKKKEINCFTPDGVSRYKQPCAECTEHKELERFVAGTPQTETLPEAVAPAAAQGTTTEAACPKCGDLLTKKRAYGGVQTYHPCDKCGVCPECGTKLEKKGQINGRQGYRACTTCKTQRSSGAREPPKKPEL